MTRGIPMFSAALLWIAVLVFAAFVPGCSFLSTPPGKQLQTILAATSCGALGEGLSPSEVEHVRGGLVSCLLALPPAPTPVPPR